MEYTVVTGASGGLGYSLTKCLIEKGYFVYAVDIAHNKFIGIDNVKYLKCDLKDPKEIEKIKDIIESDNVRIKAIYNLCGIFKMESVIEGSSEDLESIIRINFLSMYYVNKYLFNFLDKGSTIINMSSEVARYSCLPFQSYYTMTKKMVECYSDDLRRELNYLGIRVTKIEAGSLNTLMIEKASKEFDNLISSTKYFEKQLLKMKFMMDSELKNTNKVESLVNLLVKIIEKKRVKLVYRYKNSFKLKLLGILPERLQDKIFKILVKWSNRKSMTSCYHIVWFIYNFVILYILWGLKYGKTSN